MEADRMKDDLAEYNCRKLDEDAPWGNLYGTVQDILVLRAE